MLYEGNVRLNYQRCALTLALKFETKAAASLNSILPRACPVRAGVEIQGMQERVRQLQGTFEIKSGESGTTVIVVLPSRSIAGSAKSRKA